MRVPVLIIGGGLSGLAAAIRMARFNHRVLLVEKHSRLGGLNSFYYRNGSLFETGLHAITNYAVAGDKKAPLNRLLRQLKISRGAFSLCPQYGSSVVFHGAATLRFTNDIALLCAEIGDVFPQAVDSFQTLLRFIDEFDPFAIAPFRSARKFLDETLHEPLLTEMLLCPLMYYGSSYEDDMDLAQFAIMFRAIFLEGMFRPQGSIKEFLDIFINHLHNLGGEIRTRCRVRQIIAEEQGASVELDNGEKIVCDYILSTVGAEETLALLSPHRDHARQEKWTKGSECGKRLAFAENIFQLDKVHLPEKRRDSTIIFFNKNERFRYRQPQDYIDTDSGVICFPSAFDGIEERERVEIRTTHLANYARWKASANKGSDEYRQAKQEAAERSLMVAETITGAFGENISFHDMFTPLTIERYTGKIGGAIYGSPHKIKDGNLGFSRLFLAGTDQGFLGIVGSMLSGVSVVNQHILPKL